MIQTHRAYTHALPIYVCMRTLSIICLAFVRYKSKCINLRNGGLSIKKIGKKVLCRRANTCLAHKLYGTTCANSRQLFFLFNLTDWKGNKRKCFIQKKNVSENSFFTIFFWFCRYHFFPRKEGKLCVSARLMWSRNK